VIQETIILDIIVEIVSRALTPNREIDKLRKENSSLINIE